MTDAPINAVGFRPGEPSCCKTGFPMTNPDPEEVAADVAAWHADSEPERRAERLERGIIDVAADDNGRYAMPEETSG